MAGKGTPMPLWYKLMLQGLFILLTYLFVQTIRYGQKTASQGKGDKSSSYEKHRSYMTGVLCVLISTLVLLVGGLFGFKIHPRGWVFMWHEGFAAAFFVLFLLTRFWVTGNARPRSYVGWHTHRFFAYSTMFLGAAAMTSGIYLLWMIPTS